MINAADYQTLQEAANAASGDELLIPHGTWTSPGINLPSNIHIRGEGIGVTTIKLANGTNQNLLVASSRTNISLSSLTIDGNKANNTVCTGVWLGTCVMVNGHDLEIKDCADSAWAASSGSALINPDNVFATGCGAHAFNYSETSASILSRITVADCGLSAINMAAGARNIISGLQAGLSATSNNGYAALRIVGTQGVNASNIRGLNFCRTLFVLSGAKDVHVDNLLSLTTGAEAVLIQSTAQGVTSDVTLTNYRVKNSGQLAASGSRDGVRVDGVAGVSLGFGTITDTTSKMEYGLRTTDNSYGSSTDFIEAHNRISGWTVAQKSLAH